MPVESVENQFLVATVSPTARQRWIALVIVLVLVIAFAVTAPFRAIQLPRSAAFIAAFQAILFVNDLITATLLFAQFSILTGRSLLVLANGYLFTAFISIPYALTFPGLFSPTGLLGADYQTAGWLYLFWHCGLPLAVIIYALLRREHATQLSSTSARISIAFSVPVMIAVVCGLTWIATWAGTVLPWLFLDDIHISPFGRDISAAVGLLSAVALVLLWVRRRSVLDLWLLVVLSAWLLEICFFVLLTALRFSLSFYASRIYALVTSSVVLLVLLSETTRLYINLARSSVVQRREREGRLMTMNAVSASIAHEMSQPVGAMMASAEAALLWLAKTPPDLTKVRASLEHIAADGHRARDVIVSVRTLFRRSSSKMELIGVNDLIRDVVAMEYQELQRRGIGVKMQLAKTGARVSFDRGQLQQVILNLIANAVDAMSAVTDRPRVLGVKSQVDVSSGVTISIEDSGAGIDRDNIDQVFEPFFTTKSRGMGLGLWICRRIVENYNGQLTASSNLDRGSVFQIILPQAHSDAEAASPPDAS